MTDNVNRQPTGVCRVCQQRKNIGKNGKITQHLYRDGTKCGGVHVSPVQGTYQPGRKAPGKPDEYHPPTFQERIDELASYLKDGRIEGQSNIERAHRTIRHFEERLGVLD